MTARLRGALARRLLHVGVVVWAGYTLTYALLFLLPSDPVSIMVGPENVVADADVARLRDELGLDDPWWSRYLGGLAQAVTGDLGTSHATGAPVTGTILAALPSTATIAVAALVIGVLAGTALALVAGTSTGRLRDLVLALPSLALSMPTFWIGIVLLQLFSFRLPWFPAGGTGSVGSAVLPVVCLAIPATALVAQVLATRLVAVMDEPFVETARGLGSTRARVAVRHALRNAFSPALSMIGLLAGWLVSGAVVVETVFSRPGIGRLVHDAVSTQDRPMVLGLVTVSTLVFAVGALLTDLLQPVLDPRLDDTASARVDDEARPLS